jgi:hypothetical protein
MDCIYIVLRFRVYSDLELTVLRKRKKYGCLVIWFRLHSFDWMPCSEGRKTQEERKKRLIYSFRSRCVCSQCVFSWGNLRLSSSLSSFIHCIKTTWDHGWVSGKTTSLVHWKQTDGKEEINEMSNQRRRKWVNAINYHEEWTSNLSVVWIPERNVATT